MGHLSKYGLLCLVLAVMSASMQGQQVFTVEYGDTSYTYIDPDYELLRAASEGDTMKVKVFLAIGTNVDTQSWDGVTPLMFAAQNGHLRVVEILLDAGADISLKPYNQIDALLGATIAGHVLVADTLILNGASLNTRSLDGVTPLMYAAAYDHYLLCDVLLFYGADVNASDNFRNSPLHFSAFYGNLDVTKLLVEQGADLDAIDFYNFTPLMCAAQNGHLEVVDFLLQAGADMNKTNIENCTPLSLAILSRQYGISDRLLTAGADPNRNITGKVTEYELARESGGKEMALLLEAYGANPQKKIRISKITINSEINWNGGDMMVGGSMGFIESRYGLEAELGYMTRPMVRSVRYEAGDGAQYQFWEKRSVLSLGAGKRFILASPQSREYVGAVVSANAGYTYGSFRGAGQRPDDKLIFIPRAELFYNYHMLNLRVGYEYMKVPRSNLSPHRFTFTAGMNIHRIKTGFMLKKEPRL